MWSGNARQAAVTLTSDVGGINRSPTRSAAYPAGTTVTLTATPAAFQVP